MSTMLGLAFFGPLAHVYALALIVLQISLFALVVFPWQASVDSLPAVLFNRSLVARRPEAVEIAVGFFSALGRAATVAGLNGAAFAAAWALLGGPVSFAVAVGVLAVAYAWLFRMLVALPLEAVAHQRCEAALSPRR